MSKDRTRIWYLEDLAKARDKHQLDLWAWVIMPEHVHLLIYPQAGDYKIENVLASIKKPVSYKALQFIKEHAPEFLEQLTVRNANRTYHRFWQAGPGYDADLDDPEAIYKATEYIHNDPACQRGAGRAGSGLAVRVAGRG